MRALRRIRYCVVQALRSIFVAPLIHVVSIATIGVAVLILATTLLIVFNTDRIVESWSQEVRVIAFLADDVEAERLTDLERTIGQWPEVAQVFSRTRATAFEELRTSLGNDRGLLDGLTPEIMPASIEVALAAGHQTEAGLARAAERLRALPELGQIEEITFGRDLLMRLESMRDLLRLGGIAIGGLVMFAMIFIVSNTIRLALYSRRDEIEVMRLVGATYAFIRGPYYIEGLFQGLVGAAFGLALLMGLFHWLAPQGAHVIRFAVGPISLEFLPPHAHGLLIVGGGVVGMLASHVSVTRFVRAGERST